MDPRRLSTGDVLALGIINHPIPDKGVPEAFAGFSAPKIRRYDADPALNISVEIKDGLVYVDHFDGDPPPVVPADAVVYATMSYGEEIALREGSWLSDFVRAGKPWRDLRELKGVDDRGRECSVNPRQIAKMRVE